MIVTIYTLLLLLEVLGILEGEVDPIPNADVRTTLASNKSLV